MAAASGVALVLVALASGALAYESPEEFTSRWLRSVAGQGDADRGWSQLDATSREEFGGDADAYARSAAAADWSGFTWRVARAHPFESWLWHVEVRVDGGLAAVPAFLRDYRLVGPLCMDDEAAGIHLMVFQRWPWDERTLGPGGFTGSAERALVTGRCTVSEGPPPEFEPGAVPAWSGHAFHVRNNTTTPLFLRLEDGSRIDIPPCSTVNADELRGTVEVRAADGYVSTMGGVAQSMDPSVTTFIVIGATDVYLNGAPPKEPLPACDEPALVQVGV